MSTDGFTDFGFDEGDDNIGVKTERYKGKEGNTDRLSFAWFKPDGDGNAVPGLPLKFTSCERHYVQGVGYFLHKGPEFAKIAGGQPKQAVATIVVVWPTDKHGRLNKAAFATGEGFEVKPWVFSADKYGALRRRNDEFPLNEHDITAACSDSQYQKMDLSSCKENLLLTLFKSEKDSAKAIVKNILDQVEVIAKTIQTDMAREMSIDKIREKMGGASAGPVNSGPVEDVEGLLDDLLE